MKSRAVCGCTGIASVIARSASGQCVARGIDRRNLCHRLAARRVMHTASPAAERSTSSLKWAFALARLTLLNRVS
jgi:hypothetical protein